MRGSTSGAGRIGFCGLSVAGNSASVVWLSAIPIAISAAAVSKQSAGEYGSCTG